MMDVVAPGSASDTSRPAAGPAVPPPAETDDAWLVEALLARDRKATAELVARHGDAVHAFVRRRLAPRHDLVEDVVQEVFLAALKGLRSFSGRASLRSWLLGIARHRVADHYRGVLRRAEDAVDEESGAEALATFPDLDGELDESRLREKIQRVMGGLPETYAYALIWRYWEGWSARQIAQETDRTEKAVERLLARARAGFRQAWDATEGPS